MNILIISKYANPPQYGPGGRLFYLAKEFIKLGNKTALITSDSNHFAHFPNSKRRYNKQLIEGVPVYWIKTRKYKKTASASRVLSWIDFELGLFFMKVKDIMKPDVIIVSSLSIFTVIYGLFLKKRFNSFLVFEVRDIWPLTMTEEGGFRRWHPLVVLIGLIEKIGYKYSDLIVGTMPRLDIHIKETIGYNKPFHCSPIGFNLEDFRDSVKKKDNQFDIFFPEDKITVGYAGSFGITNDLGPFIEAIKMLRDEKKLYFLLIGQGDLKSSYESALANCDNVKFLPRTDKQNIRYFLDKCDILFFSTQPSKLWHYGQSLNKIVDYMLAGKPILAAYDGYPSMINEAGCGKFVHNNPDSIKKGLVEMANMQRTDLIEMGSKGKDWIYLNRPYSVLAKAYLERITAEIIKKYK